MKKYIKTHKKWMEFKLEEMLHQWLACEQSKLRNKIESETLDT